MHSFLFYLYKHMEVSFISKNVDRRNEALVNEGIRAERVLVIDDEGVSLGEQPLQS